MESSTDSKLYIVLELGGASRLHDVRMAYRSWELAEQHLRELAVLTEADLALRKQFAAHPSHLYAYYDTNPQSVELTVVEVDVLA